MAVSANQLIKRADGGLGNVPVTTAKNIYAGTMVFAASGLATDVVNSGANKFVGIAHRQADNTSGANGEISVDVFVEGVFQLKFPGVTLTQGSVGAAAYASDNYTCTTSATNTTRIGTIVEFVDANTAMVKIEPFNALHDALDARVVTLENA